MKEETEGRLSRARSESVNSDRSCILEKYLELMRRTEESLCFYDGCPVDRYKLISH